MDFAHKRLKEFEMKISCLVVVLVQNSLEQLGFRISSKRTKGDIDSKLIQLFHSELGTKPSNLAPNVPNFDRINLHIITEVGEIVSESTITLIRCHADASRNGMILLHRQMLGNSLFWRMTVRIMLASHMKYRVRRTIEPFDLTFTSKAICHGQ